jgi:hypothetical protein
VNDENIEGAADAASSHPRGHSVMDGGLTRADVVAVDLACGSVGFSRASHRAGGRQRSEFPSEIVALEISHRALGLDARAPAFPALHKCLVGFQGERDVDGGDVGLVA